MIKDGWNVVIASILLCLLPWMSPCCAQKIGKEDYFYVLNTRQGLSDNCILQMMQLPDNRLAVRTRKGVNIYDGRRFLFVPLPAGQAQKLMGYDGQTHMYADVQDRLWIKDYHSVFCIDLRRNALLSHPLDFLKRNLERDSIDDIFVDSRKAVWVVKDHVVTNVADGNQIALEKAWGDLQDLDVEGKYVYTFHASGMVAAFMGRRLVYTRKAYSLAEARKFRSTSLVVKTPSGQFYQIRTGFEDQRHGSASVFLRFDPEQGKYSKLFDCDYILHTLNMSSDNQALISSQQGYLMFDFRVGNMPREVKKLSLPDGKSIVTGINTVYRDCDGAIWLGTYNDGLVYVSPMLGLFFTIDKPWWQSGWGIAVISVLALLVIGGAVYSLRKKKEKCAEPVSCPAEYIPVAETPEPEFVAKARLLVEQHLEENEYGVEQLANDLCMERTGLYKKMKSLSGITPVAFMRNVRLQRAAVLLKEGKLSVNEVAEITGFGSPSYFAKCFKKAYGVLPSEYK